MNHKYIKQSKLVKELNGDTQVFPDKFNKIKTKQITQFVIENNKDLSNCLDMLRYFMVDELPKEIFDYLNRSDVDHDEIKEILNINFKDFFNKELNDYLFVNSRVFLSNYDKINQIPDKVLFGIRVYNIMDLCLVKKYDGDKQFTTKEIKKFEDDTLECLKKERPEWFNGGIYNVKEYCDLFDQYYDAIKWEHLCKDDEEIERLKELSSSFDNHYNQLHNDVDIKNDDFLDYTKSLDGQMTDSIFDGYNETIIHVDGCLIKQIGITDVICIVPKNNSKEGYYELYQLGLRLVTEGRLYKSDLDWTDYNCDCEYK